MTIQTNLLIGNSFEAGTETAEAILNPRTGGLILNVPEASQTQIDRAVAAGGGPMALEDLKIIVLMVFWSLGEEPDALILDELFVDAQDRLIH